MPRYLHRFVHVEQRQPIPFLMRRTVKRAANLFPQAIDFSVVHDFSMPHLAADASFESGEYVQKLGFD
jgi:hypothetical protein